jgi:F-type H+-transporting ATPase subunit epsilon
VAKEKSAEKLKLEIISKDGTVVLSEMVELVTFPGESGSFTVMYDHTPFLSSLKYGYIKYKIKEHDTNYKFVTVIGGFCEVNNNNISVITNAAEKLDDLDVERAKESRNRAEKRIKDNREKLDIARAEVSLKRAVARISAYEESVRHAD